MLKHYAKNAREVCWDMTPIQESQGIRVDMHKPVRKEVVMTLDKPWEGNCCGYLSVVKYGDGYRLYYRGSKNGEFRDNSLDSYKPAPTIGLPGLGRGVICMLETKDGKHFTHSDVNTYHVEGYDSNNIIYTEPDKYLDNFSVFYDTNPNCPADAKFKALRAKNRVLGEDEDEMAFYANHAPGSAVPSLLYLKSADGIHFEEVGFLPIVGDFDSFNLGFWDEVSQQYFIYARAKLYHFKENDPTKPAVAVDCESHVRQVLVITSKDFEHWDEQKIIDFGDGDNYQLYTNQVQKYYRAENMFLGIPTRYLDRNTPEQFNSFQYLKLPGADDARLKVIEYSGREGSAFTDAVLMTSRDGVRFNRTDEAFLTPGIQNGSNWIYGDCYFAHGMIETESDIPGEPNEISLYVGDGYRTRNVDILRYTVRLDGFFSWHADYKGGSLLTKPFTFQGDKLHINFETSARGYVRIQMCNEAGTPIDGYDSGLLFGNDVDRNVDFEKSLADLNGKAVTMKITMGDAELYSYIFC